MSTRILLADEHQMVREGLRTLLNKEPDFQVVAEANTEEAAVRLVVEAMPDVVILDLALTGSQGSDPVRQLVAAAPAAKVIGLSMYGDRKFVVEVLKAGAIGYVLKDSAFEELAAAIRAVQDHKIYLSRGLSDIVIQDYLELLRDSEARFRTIFEDSSSGLALVDHEGRIVESNPALQELLGYSQDELSGRGFTEFTWLEEGVASRDWLPEDPEGNRDDGLLERQYKRKDGRLAWGRISVSPLRGVGGNGRFAIGLLEDISKRKQAETTIRDYQEKLRTVALELSLTEERERRRLATELHEQVGQILALAQIKLRALRKSPAASLTGPMEEVMQLLDQTIRYTRSRNFELSPPILYDLGFEAAVEWLAELLQEQYGIRLKVAVDRSPKPLDDEVRVLLFQLVRELLVKVVKDANPKNVAVLISGNDGNLEVKIENDGFEMDLNAESPRTSTNSIGVFSLRERLQYLGGSLKVDTAPGYGTRLNLLVPLRF